MARRWLVAALWWMLAAGATADERALVDARWLREQIDDPRLVLLDASAPAQHRERRIPGSRSASPWTYLMGDLSPAVLQRRFRAWGLHADSVIVVYDRGASWEAARVFHDLDRHGVASGRLHLLDGGLAAWMAAGGTVAAGAPEGAAAATMAVEPGSIELGAPDPRQASSLEAVFEAAGAPTRMRLLDALEPAYYFGAQRFFDRGGHLPMARNWPLSQLFDPERKTFRPVAELRAAARRAGVDPDLPVHVYCGGGGAAAGPWFVLRHLLGHEEVRLYTGSLKQWLEDPRGLPLWGYAQPALARDTAWALTWASGMLRQTGQAHATMVDVRDASAYRLGHFTDALSLPAADLRRDLADPSRLAAHLAQAGLDPAHEAVIVADGGLNRDAALAWLALRRAGQARVSVLMGSPEAAAGDGVELLRGAADRRPRPVAERAGKVLATEGLLPDQPEIVLAVGATPPVTPPAGRWLHLPWRQLVDRAGRPRPAAEIWLALDRVGLPPLARVRVIADDAADAAAGLYLLQLMGWRDSDVSGP